ncbi:hypothetical protein PAL_GLEAN10010532 [Pteropus alecto]|uniref:Uncharacterized protein n=1 Tax=Pteropus alecto TaxID=9402 RepID=L5KQC8_PTEAL|nr:hypothetical protein PAL_GLEAN10010532 [Pteropus alecto]
MTQGTSVDNEKTQATATEEATCAGAAVEPGFLARRSPTLSRESAAHRPMRLQPPPSSWCRPLFRHPCEPGRREPGPRGARRFPSGAL